ncbi:MAG: DNA polymerase IV [Clostridiales bacterium]|jgi:DNA polymerase-4|nr:DNA polymerase IV [Clostridiales bacterium]
MERVILHSDLNNFYASVEEILRPALKGAPLAVCGNPAKRHGIVLAKNLSAKAAGVKTGDTVWQAQRKCLGIVCAAPHFDEYARYSEKVFDLYVRFTDRVEPFGNDECWLDVTGSRTLFGSGREIAEQIRRLVRAETGLTVSVGVSFNKVFAKLGSDLKKPDAVTEITRDNFRAKVWPLPAGDMPGVGRITAERLQKIGVRTIGDLAATDETALSGLFGVLGPRMKQAAAGLDGESVRPYNERRALKSVGHGATSANDMRAESEIRDMVYFLSDRVAARLRRYGLKALAAAVHLRTADFVDSSRRAPLPYPTSNGAELARAAFGLVWKQNPGPLRALTVSAYNLVADAENGEAAQLSLFGAEPDEKARRLDAAADALRAKYGANAVTRGNLLYNDYAADRFDSDEAGFLPFKR